MGRPGLTRHRKFLRLARALDDVQLGFGEVLARGALELIWDAAYENGDPLLGDADDVEGAARWRGPSGALCEALLAAGGQNHAGFIEEVDGRPGQYQVHDLFDHAPDYVERRAKREAERQAKGKTISDLRREAATVRWAREKQTADTCMTGAAACTANADGCNANVATPAPAPAPLKTSEPSARRAAAKEKPDHRLKPLTDAMVRAFAEVRNGETYPHQRAKDTQALKRLLSIAEPSEIIRRWRVGLSAVGFHRVQSFAELAMPEKWNHHAGPAGSASATKLFAGFNDDGAAVFAAGTAP